MKKATLYDTTLRDGAQTEGVSFSLADKLRIAEKLNYLGIHYIEGGWPGSNLKDMEFYKESRKLKLKGSTVVAFGSTRRPNSKAANDPNIKAILKSGVEAATIFGKTWDLHVKDVLKAPLDENLRMIEDSLRLLKSKGLTVFYDAEHFFDGYCSNPTYALRTLRAAQSAGADCIILCDTNGGTLTSHLCDVINEVKTQLKSPLGIHAHNDCELAVANSIAAVEHGVSQVQGTMNGYGERCGNANLVSVIGNLKLKLGIDCVSDSKLKELTEVARFVSEISNVKPQMNQPFVGESAFAHKAGVHINAMVKNPKTYEHIEPQRVGNKRRFLVSELSGRSSLMIKAEELALGLKRDTPKARRMLKLLQQLENEGYHFEAAEGSLELLMKRAMKQFKRFFSLEGFRVIIERREGDDKLISEATIKIRVKGVQEHTAALGDGPVNALDNALRKALEEFYPNLKNMRLTDFKVRVINEKAGTAAKVRVLIQSQDETSSWWTIGVSENVIEASWLALVDSVEYKLLKDAGHSHQV